ncbi:hypothetical protein AWB74_07598 [Caballeronia arvi]|uniref:Lipoprotein n=1 Tax=Caballeronia arvi TaxID=1777135 RepID=A0A158L0K4_9BURK|nr:hypothetical protein AWB74_07598 [Caballeronia arvi]
MKLSLMTAAVAATFSLAGLAQAQQSTDTSQSMPAQAQQSGQTSSGDTAYGGATPTRVASGKSSTLPNNCSPQPFCNIYSGGQ